MLILKWNSRRALTKLRLRRPVGSTFQRAYPFQCPLNIPSPALSLSTAVPSSCVSPPKDFVLYSCARSCRAQYAAIRTAPFRHHVRTSAQITEVQSHQIDIIHYRKGSLRWVDFWNWTVRARPSNKNQRQFHECLNKAFLNSTHYTKQWQVSIPTFSNRPNNARHKFKFFLSKNE